MPRHSPFDYNSPVNRFFQRGNIPYRRFAFVAVAFVGACALKQIPTQSQPYVISPGPISVVMPRLVCHDTDSVGTRFSGKIYRYDVSKSVMDSVIPEGALGHAAVKAYNKDGSSLIEFRLDSITINGKNVRIDPPAIGGSKVESIYNPRRSDGSGAICYSTGAVFTVGLEKAIVVPR